MAQNADQHWANLCESKCLTLMHLYLMVFKKYLEKTSQKDFAKDVLSKDITRSIDFETYHNAASNLLRKVTGQVTQAQYCEIKDRLRNPEMVAFDEQNRVLRKLTEPFANKIWGAMKTEYQEANGNTYMDVFKTYSPWLFIERNLDEDDPGEEMIYKMLTVAIFISVNQQTGSGDKAEDELDILCQRYLEELPDFSLRTLFDTLFADHCMFAVKRGDHYAVISRRELTALDCVNILLPDNELRYSFTPAKDEDAQKLLDNQIGQETTRRVLGFFECYGANVWSLLVSHIHETFARCQLVAEMQYNGIKNKKTIERTLSEMSDKDSSKLMKVFRNRLDDEDGNNVYWISDVCDSFWGGVRAAYFLPSTAETEFDAQKLCECIASYLLIAVYCLKMDGSAVPSKRRKFRKKLEAQIRQVFFNNNQGSAELIREKEWQLQEKDQKIAELEQKLDKERTDNAETHHIIDVMVTILNGALSELHLNSPIERREHIEVFCRRNGLTLDQIPEFDKLINEYDAPMIKKLITNSADWGNGGIE